MKRNNLHISVSNAAHSDALSHLYSILQEYISRSEITVNQKGNYSADRLLDATVIIVIPPNVEPHRSIHEDTPYKVGKGQYETIRWAIDNNIPIYMYDGTNSPFKIIEIKKSQEENWRLNFGKVTLQGYKVISQIIKESFHKSEIQTTREYFEELNEANFNPFLNDLRGEDKGILDQVETRNPLLLAVAKRKRKK